MEGEAVILFRRIALLLESIFAYMPKIYSFCKEEKRLHDLLLSGVLYRKSVLVREIFQELIFFLAANISCQEFLSELIKVDLFVSGEDISELCELAVLLLDICKKKEIKPDGEFDPRGRLRDFLDRIFKASSDTSLVGLLTMAEKLASSFGVEKELPYETRIGHIRQLFAKCLFPARNAEADSCRSAESRDAAFMLVSTLAGTHPKCLDFILKDCIEPLKGKVSTSMSWNYEPDKHKKSPAGYVGIKNLGSICYMSSMIQQFFLLEPFRNAILSLKIKEKLLDNMLYQLQNIFVYLLRSNRRDVNPQDFCFSFKEPDGSPINVKVQHDAHEFLNILFERLEHMLKDTPYDLLLKHIFGGQLCSQVMCTKCKNVSKTYEDYYTLSIEAKNQKNIYEGLERFIAASTVSDYLCEECKNTCDINKRNLLSTLPNVLIVHLQRFSFNFDTLANEKINSQFDFPNVIDMTPYTEEGSELKALRKKAKKSDKPGAEQSAEAQSSEELRGEDLVKAEAQLKQKEYYQYKLVGILIHNGNAQAGHYYSFINVDRGENEGSAEYLSTEKNRWIEFNDSLISEFDFSRVPAECFGGSLEESSANEARKAASTNPKSAYMLIYEKAMKLPIPVKVEHYKRRDDDIVLDSLDFAGKETELVSDIKECKQVMYKDGYSCYRLYNFHKTPLAIPKETEVQVEQDNIQYVFENLMYTKEFVKFICSIFAQCYRSLNATPPAKGLEGSLSMLCADFVIPIFPYVKLSGLACISQIEEVAVKFFKADHDASVKLLESLRANSNQTLDVLVKCPEPAIRQYISRISVAAFLKVHQTNSAVALSFLDMLVNHIGYDLAEQWTKFKQFFETLRDIAVHSDPKVTLHLLSQNFIVKALDFFLDSQSPVVHPPSHKPYEMGNAAQAPDFNALVEVISFLAGNVKFCPENPENDPRVLHPESDAAKCLLSAEVLKQHLKCNGKVGGIAKLISRMSTQEEYERRICAEMLKWMNQKELDNAVKVLGLVGMLGAKEDERQDARLEWLLGYSQVREANDGEENYAFVSGLDGSAQPLLQLVWTHRKRAENFAAEGIEVLLRLMARSDRVREFVKRMPAVCNIHLSYIEWIKEYVNVHEKLDTNEKVLRDIKPELAKFLQKEPMPILYPYRVGRCIGESVLKTVVDKNVKLVLREMRTDVFIRELASEVYAGCAMCREKKAEEAKKLSGMQKAEGKIGKQEQSKSEKEQKKASEVSKDIAKISEKARNEEGKVLSDKKEDKQSKREQGEVPRKSSKVEHESKESEQKAEKQAQSKPAKKEEPSPQKPRKESASEENISDEDIGVDSHNPLPAQYQIKELASKLKAVEAKHDPSNPRHKVKERVLTLYSVLKAEVINGKLCAIV